MLFSSCRRATVWCLLLPVPLAAQEAPKDAAQEAAVAKCIFSGAVHDSVTGLPVAKATVNVFSRDGDKPSYLTTTGADGAFRFEAIGAGDYTIQVSAPG